MGDNAANDRAQAVLRRLEDEDRADRSDGTPQSGRLRAISPEVGRFLQLLVKIGRTQRLLEIGTSGGYSTITLALALRETGCTITSLELDPAKVERAGRNLAEAGVEGIVTVREGDALAMLTGLGSGSFDFVFLDFEKELYLQALEPIVRVLAPCGLLVADNLLSHADDLAEFRAAAETHPELECVLIPIPRGELVCRKRGD